jgi:hypothetical protein
MIWRLITIAAAIDTAIVLGISVAWGASGPSRDAGDATAASLALTTPAQVIRDSGDATAARLVLSCDSLQTRSHARYLRGRGAIVELTKSERCRVPQGVEGERRPGVPAAARRPLTSPDRAGVQPSCNRPFRIKRRRPRIHRAQNETKQ